MSIVVALLGHRLTKRSFGGARAINNTKLVHANVYSGT
jgi:hypothetical protein